MAGKTIYDPLEPEDIDHDSGVIREISTILVEETIDNVADPRIEGGHMMEDTNVFTDDRIDNTVHPWKPELQGSDVREISNMLACETEKIQQAGGGATKLSTKVEVTIGNTVPSGETERMVGHQRRNSTTMVGAPIHKLKVPSRYLRASAGSCHDLCKYGRKNDFAENGKGPMLRTISESHLNKAASTAGSKKKPFFRLLSFPGTKAERQNTLHVEGMRVSAKRNCGPKEKHIDQEMNSSSPCTSGRTRNRRNIEVKMGMKMGALESSSPMFKEMKIRKDAGSYNKGDQKPMGPVSASVSSRPPVRKAASMNPRLYRNLKGLPHVKNNKRMQEAKVIQPDYVPEKTLYMIEPNGESKTAETSQTAVYAKDMPNTPRGHHVRKNTGSRGIQNGTHSAYSYSSPSASSSSESTLSKMQDASRVGGAEDGASESALVKQSAVISQGGKYRIKSPKEKSNMKYRVKSKNMEVSQTADTDSKTWRMKFRRGTVVTLPNGNNSPKKLKFKRGKVAGEIQNGDNPRRSFKEKEVTADESHVREDESEKVALRMKFRRGTVVKLHGANSSPKKLKFKREKVLGEIQNGDDPGRSLKKTEIVDKSHAREHESEKIVLKHQEASNKRDSLSLNNVIEETASELVKTRKSKVKALVGAFESVMFLRDRKTVAAPSVS
ncbi:hypothetical protein Ancab_035982 [Ancistrocladus abbreviatus]